MVARSTATLIIPSEVRLVDLVHCSAEKMAEVAGFPEGEALDIAIAVREAAINAIRHGNGEDPSTRVHVVLEANGAGLTVEVRDEGPGFDPDGAPDPTEGDNLLRTSGRGLLLIRAFVDDVRFRYEQGRGMTVTLEKKLRRDDENASNDGDGPGEGPVEDSGT